MLLFELQILLVRASIVNATARGVQEEEEAQQDKADPISVPVRRRRSQRLLRWSVLLCLGRQLLKHVLLIF